VYDSHSNPLSISCCFCHMLHVAAEAAPGTSATHPSVTVTSTLSRIAVLIRGNMVFSLSNGA